MVRAVRRGDYDFVFIATPCESYSPAHDPRLRTRLDPMGTAAPADWRRYIDKHNLLAAATAEIFVAASVANVPAVIENPADRGLQDSPAFWAAAAECAPLWLMPVITHAMQAVDGGQVTFAQCAFGAAFQKYTTLAFTPDLRELLGALAAASCEHGFQGHDEVAYGVDAQGRPRAARAAAYPAALNRFLADVIGRAVAARWCVCETYGTAHAAARQQAITTGGGGFLHDGPELSPLVAAACGVAQAQHMAYASPQLRVAESTCTLRTAALPGDLHAPMRTTKPRRAARLKREWQRRYGASRGCASADCGGCSAARCLDVAEGASRADTAPPPGPIRIEQLYSPGVYDDVIVPWLRRADQAATRFRAGERVPPLPRLVIGAERQPAWARGIVWDCSDPLDCRPVSRSTRHTQFKGTKQIDRQAIRDVASQLDWHDDDLLGQIGEGGVEPRTECALETVLAFHHPGLVDEFEHAARTVAADIADEFTDAPVPHLPFVPCRLAPRDVIMQERQRLRPDGTLEDYLKPRITTNLSDGGDDAVNHGVPPGERGVELPSVQQLGRAAAICDLATADRSGNGEDGRARAQAYVIDAESAYRYLVIQEADLWTNCFLWWGDDGRAGVCVDRRLGFGGAFAPNRFERTSRLVAAWIQKQQSDFDSWQPPNTHECWAADRRAAQAEGSLVAAEAQLHPRYLQVFIDDFTGIALNDPVRVPRRFRGMQAWGAASAAGGCIAPRPDARVHVHALLAIEAMQRVGLRAAAQKTQVGSPVVGLGLRMDIGRGVLDLPDNKRSIMLADVLEQRKAAVEGRVHRPAARRLTGRLCAAAQVAPQLRALLHGGYAVAGKPGKRRPQWMRGDAGSLRSGSGAQLDWLGLLDAATEALEQNEGVPLASREHFPAHGTEGVVCVTSDASLAPSDGDDGVGGYVFFGAQRRAVVVSEPWPPDIRDALLAAQDETEAAARRRGRAHRPWISFAAAELFGSVAVARAAGLVARGAPTYAVGDSTAAAACLNRGASRRGGLLRLTRWAHAWSAQWRGVAVPRELNVHADILSHPSRWREVVDAARAAGIAVDVVRIDTTSWDALRDAIAHEHLLETPNSDSNSDGE